MRTRLAALGAACALLVVAGCGPTYDRDAAGNDPAMAVPPDSASASPAPTDTAAPGGKPSGKPSGKPARATPSGSAPEEGLAACTTADLGTAEIVDATVLEAEPSAPGRGAGQLAFDLRLTNTSDAACTLAGYPGLRLRGDWTAGEPDATVETDVRRLPGDTAPVELEPDGTTVVGVVTGSTICLTEPARVELVVAAGQDPLVLEHPEDSSDRTWFCYDEGTDVAPYGTGRPDAAIER